MGGNELNHRFDRRLARTSLGSRRASWTSRLVSLSAWLLLTASVALPQATDPPAKPAAKTNAAKPVAAGPLVKSYGSSSAPIKLEVFTDYQCPSCRTFYESSLRQLIASDYIATGKLYLVHHDFPLQAHMYSGMAARWANAAAQVGAFSAVEAALYDNQDAWGASGDIAKYVAAAMPAADFKRVEV